MAPFCLLAEVNEEIYPGPTRAESKSGADSASSPSASSRLSPGFTFTQVVPMPGFVCPTGFLSSGLTEVAVRLEIKYSSFLVSELSDPKTAQTVCSWKADLSRVSQSEHPQVNNSSLLLKCAWMETAALCVQSSSVHLYTCMWRDTSLHIHTCKQTSVLKIRWKIQVKDPSLLCLTGCSRDLAHFRTNVLPSVFLTRVLNPPTFIFWDFINIFQVFNCLSVFPHSPNSDKQNELIHFRFK